ncbi:MAG: recombinase [Flavobacteriales bacterium]
MSTEHRIPQLLAKYFGPGEAWRDEPDELRILVRIVGELRRVPAQDGHPTIAPLLDALRANEAYRNGLSAYLTTVLRGKRIRYSLTDNAILSDTHLWREVIRRLSFKLLPDQPDEHTIGYVLNNVFYRRSDTAWVRAMPEAELEELFTLLQLPPIHATKTEDSTFADLLFAASILAHRISGRALEADVLRMVPEYEQLGNPFLAFQRELDNIIEDFLQGSMPSQDAGHEDNRQLRVLLGQCVDYINTAFANSERFGISIRVNQNLLRIRQQLERLGVVLDLLTITPERTAKHNTIELVRRMIEFHGGKNDLRGLIEESTRLTAYEITQHTGNTGEHYITSSAAEYRRMFLSAAGGGLIVGVMCILKVMLGHLHPNLFGKAFFYSMNYAWGFIAIYLTGATLATKQPAMTAATVVKSLQNTVGNTEQYGNFADLFARLFRSQFIAFVGNVLLAFPMALGLSMLIERISGWNIAADRWEPLITDISPVHSLAIPHAAIAGVFLFLSGIIAGSVANRGKHERIALRIRRHPWLLSAIGIRRTERLSRFYQQHWAGILSNFWFGVFMGSTAVVGIIFGLPLDIRHITFVSGNLGIALQGAHFHIGPWPIFWAIIGIGVIGFVNFAVSFGLSLSLAMRSRGIPFSDLQEIITAVWRHFRRHPLRFFLPHGRREKEATS